VYVLFFNDSDKLDGLCRRFGLNHDLHRNLEESLGTLAKRPESA